VGNGSESVKMARGYDDMSLMVKTASMTFLSIAARIEAL
jgi:hypothetical protein